MRIPMLFLVLASMIHAPESRADLDVSKKYNCRVTAVNVDPSSAPSVEVKVGMEAQRPISISDLMKFSTMPLKGNGSEDPKITVYNHLTPFFSTKDPEGKHQFFLTSNFAKANEFQGYIYISEGANNHINLEYKLFMVILGVSRPIDSPNGVGAYVIPTPSVYDLDCAPL